MAFDIINRIKKERGLTNAQISELSGVTLSTLEKITSGANRNPKLDTLQALCNVLGCTLNDFMDNPPQTKKAPPEFSEEAKQVAKDYDKLSDHGKGAVRAILQYESGAAEKKKDEPVRIHNLIKVIHLPHAWDKASAGTGFDLSEERMDEWMVVYNDDTRKADFCVDVAGRSMEPLFRDGDTILVRRQPSVDVGEIGLFVVDGRGYVKRQADGYLESINPEFENIIPEEYSFVECKGKVVGVLRDDWLVRK